MSTSGQTARIITFTVDRLAFSPSPPLISAIIAFERGGRLQSELTDVRLPLHVGDAVIPRLPPRRDDRGIQNYLCKARPVYRTAPAPQGDAGPEREN